MPAMFRESTVSLALTDFRELLRKYHAVTSSVPSHLHEGAIHVAYNARDRHLFAGEVNFSATWISNAVYESRCVHHGLSPG
jgi:hypothetical protein